MKVEIDAITKLTFQKCGEIKTSPAPNDEFYLMCGFCENIYLQLNTFVSHINIKHKHLLKKGNSFHQSNEIGDPLETNTTVGDIREESEEQVELQTYTSSDNEGSEKDVEFVDNRSDVDEVCDKAFTLALIAEYESHRLLWDLEDPQARNRKQREEAYKEITTNVNKVCNTNLNWKTTIGHIRKIRCKFRSEMLNEKLTESKRKKYERPWYYDQLSFLHAAIKYNNRRKRGAKVLDNEKPALPFTDLTDTQNLDIINIYKDFPCLWDAQHIGYRFKNRRQEAITNMQAAIKANTGLSFTKDELQKRIYQIRYACTQEKHRKLQCNRFKKPFQPNCKYYNEISFLEDNVGPFKCSECEEILNGIDRYRIHMSSHNGSMPFKCHLCDRGFMKVGNCTVHMRRHTREYEFECKVCKKKFATSTDLNVHMRNHTGEKPYFCDVCGQSFRTWTIFDTHMRRHQKRPNYKCNICLKSFYENGKLNEHMKAHLNVRDKICNVCGKAFTAAKYLLQHKQIHAEKKKYICKICGKNFAQYAGLSGHMKSHGTTLINTNGSGTSE